MQQVQRDTRNKMNSSDRHLYKIVILAGILAVLVYFQRKSRNVDKVEITNIVKDPGVKFPNTRVFETGVLPDGRKYKVRGLKWVAEANQPIRTNSLLNESGNGNGDSASAQVRATRFVIF